MARKKLFSSFLAMARKKRISEQNKSRKRWMRKLMERSLSRLQSLPTDKDYLEGYANLMKRYSNLSWSWADVRPDIIPAQYDQRQRKIGNCWAVALYRHWYALMKLAGRDTDGGLTIESISAGLEPHLKNKNGGTYGYHVVKQFMMQYVDEMVVYERPPETPFEDFEKTVENFLALSPLAVSIDFFKSYDPFNQLILIPTEMERDISLSAVLKGILKHCLLLVGDGICWINGESIPYWIMYDSHGLYYGERGFIRVAKKMGLIMEFVQLKLKDDSKVKVATKRQRKTVNTERKIRRKEV